MKSGVDVDDWKVISTKFRINEFWPLHYLTVVVNMYRFSVCAVLCDYALIADLII